MLIEAILSVCLTTPILDWKGDMDSGPTCVRMPMGNRTFESMGQCEFWLKQGKMEVSTKEHRDAMYKLIPWKEIEDATPMIKGECKATYFDEPYICQDCNL
jgi:hypothetical protein